MEVIKLVFVSYFTVKSQDIHRLCSGVRSCVAQQYEGFRGTERGREGERVYAVLL